MRALRRGEDFRFSLSLVSLVFLGSLARGRDFGRCSAGFLPP